MTARGNEPICGIVGAGKGTVRQHIAVKVVADCIAVESDQSIVSIVCKTTVRSIGDIACGVVSEGFFRKNVVVQILRRSLGYSAEAIISITEFGILVKMLCIKMPPPNRRLVGEDISIKDSKFPREQPLPCQYRLYGRLSVFRRLVHR